MTINDLVAEAKLREILDGCEGVTPGPWRHHIPDPGYCSDYILSDSQLFAPDKKYLFRNLVAETDIRHAPPGDPQMFTSDAKPIARLDPATVHSMVTEVLASRAEVERLKAEIAELKHECILSMETIAEGRERAEAAETALATARRETWEEAAQVAEAEGVTPETKVWNVRHGQRIAAALRAKGAAQPGKPEDGI